ncbi:MAG: ATP-binding protein, partial [Leptolyngbyaceae cyanobacterium SL_7_1]|nr:ATP-binding protein [Leptolyngbyaceae cyanobacterium SL_7_1]
MNSTPAQPQDSWQLLWTELAQIRQYLDQQIARVQNKTVAETASSIAAAPTLDRLCQTFGLSQFERHILLLCVGMELDKTLAALCAEAQGDRPMPYPTFELALAALPHPHWSALTPTSPLRRWRLIEVGAGQTLLGSPLRVDEWVLHSLTGADCCDDRLTNLIHPIAPPPALVPSHQHLASQLAHLWQSGSGDYPVVQLHGEDTNKPAIVAAACAQLGWSLFGLSALALPTQPTDLQTLVVLWQ